MRHRGLLPLSASDGCPSGGGVVAGTGAQPARMLAKAGGGDGDKPVGGVAALMADGAVGGVAGWMHRVDGTVVGGEGGRIGRFRGRGVDGPVGGVAGSMARRGVDGTGRSFSDV